MSKYNSPPSRSELQKSSSLLIARFHNSSSTAALELSQFHTWSTLEEARARLQP